jgi:iron(II)-dependent oxidoreductase
VRPLQPGTLPRGGAESVLEKDRCRELLAEARDRTLSLVDPVSDADLNRVHDPLMSPLVWDLGHIAAFEDLWLCQRAGGLAPLRPELAEVYDAAETPRARRGELPYLRRHEALAFLEEVRERALGVLDRADLSPDGDRLNAGGLVWEMLVQHEQQHNETMLQTLQLAKPGTFAPERRELPRRPPLRSRSEAVRVEEGPFELGAAAEGFAYDNERPRQRVELPPFDLDRTPVTNAAYAEFVAEGCYRRRELWTAAGWEWRERERIERPLYWTADGAVRSFERTSALDPHHPVTHVSWFEADAYARWRGKRLPTELEWEKAASWDEAAGAKRRHPWGDDPPSAERANLDQTAYGTAPVDAHPGGVAASGATGLCGDAWEWTASDFAGYPGFRAFPYREYSEVFFGGGFKVLRGGSWATRPRAIRTTFRNWDYPHRRQIFAGFRCAADA